MALRDRMEGEIDDIENMSEEDFDREFAVGRKVKLKVDLKGSILSIRMDRNMLPSSASDPTMKGLVPTTLMARPAMVGSPAEVSMDSPSMNAAAPNSGLSLATGGTTSSRRVIKTILCTLGRSI